MDTITRERNTRMDVTRFDQLGQDIGAILSRRGLLRAGALGTLGLGLGVVTAQQTSAMKGKKRKTKGDVNKLCQTQVAPCQELLTAACGGDAKCLATVQTCCPKVGTCDFGGFFACVEVNQA
jgi:hypothetical protein